MKKIKAYFLFTGWKYKLGIFLGLPAAVLITGPFCSPYVDRIPLYGYLVIIGLICVEILADQGVFNGIQARRGYKLDFFKTSSEGVQALQWGLTLDMVRRLLTTAVCVALSLLTGAQTADDGIAEYLAIMLAVYITETLGLFISRYTRSLTLCIFTIYGCLPVGIAGFTLVRATPLPVLWVMDAVLALAAAALSVTAVRTAMKKWRLTYFDALDYTD